MGQPDQPLLRVENLSVRYVTPTGVVDALRKVSFELGREKVGIVGESGSGKSTLGRAILRLIPRPGQVTADRIEFMNAVLGTTILIGAMYVTLNLLSDLLYYIIDPRSR